MTLWLARNWRVTLGVVMMVLGVYWLFTGDGRLLYDVKSGITAIILGAIIVWYPKPKVIFSTMLIWMGANVLIAFTHSPTRGIIALLTTAILGYCFYTYNKKRQQ